MLAGIARAEIIDRIAVSVGNQVITTSDIDREIRVVAFQQHVPANFSPVSRRAAADRLVEQRLIGREIENSRYPAPADSEVEQKIAQIRKDIYPTDEEYRQALAQYGITADDFKAELVRQRTMILFTDVRFRPGIQVSEAEIEDYFHKTVEPAARAAHPGQPLSIEEYHDTIEETLTGQRVDQQLDTWLQQARQRVDVVYHEEAFR